MTRDGEVDDLVATRSTVADDHAASHASLVRRHTGAAIRPSLSFPFVPTASFKSDKFLLNCSILGRDIERVFPVEISH